MRFSARYETWERAIRSDLIKGGKWKYLRADGAVGVDEGGIEEALFEVEIGVTDGATDETFEGADGVPKVGGLLGLGWLADGALFRAKRDERSARHMRERRSRRRRCARCSTIGDFVDDDVDAAVSCDTNLRHGQQRARRRA